MKMHSSWNGKERRGQLFKRERERGIVVMAWHGCSSIFGCPSSWPKERNENFKTQETSDCGQKGGSVKDPLGIVNLWPLQILLLSLLKKLKNVCILLLLAFIWVFFWGLLYYVLHVRLGHAEVHESWRKNEVGKTREIHRWESHFGGNRLGLFLRGRPSLEFLEDEDLVKCCSFVCVLCISITVTVQNNWTSLFPPDKNQKQPPLFLNPIVLDSDSKSSGNPFSFHFYFHIRLSQQKYVLSRRITRNGNFVPLPKKCFDGPKCTFLRVMLLLFIARLLYRAILYNCNAAVLLAVNVQIPNDLLMPRSLSPLVFVFWPSSGSS